LFCGSCSEPEFYEQMNVELIIDPIFLYEDFKISDEQEIQSKYKAVQEKARTYFKKNHIIHFHNLNLAKNPFWTMAISELAHEGFPVFNHAHDFSEDRRENQKFMERIVIEHFQKDINKVMYPKLPNYHIGVLTHHDYHRIQHLGFNENNLHYLPNPIDVCDVIPKASEEVKKQVYKDLHLDEEKGLVTYPVRAIRRKNIGEFILLNLFFGDRFHFVITQPPTSYPDVKEYRRWKGFCQKNKIPIVFEAGNKTDYKALVSASDFCVTTSTQEGFGMVFLEPWMMSTPVTGRNLTNITKDLIKSELSFPALYNDIRVPFKGELTDFANLSYKNQRRLLEELIQDETTTMILKTSNLHLKKIFEPVKETVIKNNQQVIQEKFSLKAYGKRLFDTYSKFVV
jgi:glycosyltransferase involved in cell wall biosynthesis